MPYSASFFCWSSPLLTFHIYTAGYVHNGKYSNSRNTELIFTKLKVYTWLFFSFSSSMKHRRNWLPNGKCAYIYVPTFIADPKSLCTSFSFHFHIQIWSRDFFLSAACYALVVDIQSTHSLSRTHIHYSKLKITPASLFLNCPPLHWIINSWRFSRGSVHVLMLANDYELVHAVVSHVTLTLTAFHHARKWTSNPSSWIVCWVCLFSTEYVDCMWPLLCSFLRCECVHVFCAKISSEIRTYRCAVD